MSLYIPCVYVMEYKIWLVAWTSLSLICPLKLAVQLWCVVIYLLAYTLFFSIKIFTWYFNLLIWDWPRLWGHSPWITAFLSVMCIRRMFMWIRILWIRFFKDIFLILLWSKNIIYWWCKGNRQEMGRVYSLGGAIISNFSF